MVARIELIRGDHLVVEEVNLRILDNVVQELLSMNVTDMVVTFREAVVTPNGKVRVHCRDRSCSFYLIFDDWKAAIKEAEGDFFCEHCHQ